MSTFPVRKRVRKADLIGLSPCREVCIFRIDDDGTLHLDHVQMNLEDDNGQEVASIVFNGETVIPPGRFEWTWKKEADSDDKR